ncbi:hypothetical protein AAC387_Pa12g1252 [Persea americana]
MAFDNINLVPLLVSLSQTCTTMRELRRIHARVLRHNLQLNNLIIAKMLRFAAVSPSGDLHYAHNLFSHMHQPNTFFYNTLIRGHAKNSQTLSQSVSIFKQMRVSSIPPDEFTFTFLLKARAQMPVNLGSLSQGEEIHGHVLKFGFCCHIYVQNALIHLYAARGVSGNARKVFDEMRAPDVVSWSGLVVAHVKAREMDNARWVFDQMPERDVVSWTVVISGYARVGRSTEALELFWEMQAERVQPDEVTMVSVISACTSIRDLEAGLSVHRYIKESRFAWMVSLCNALIDMYSKCGCMEKAWEVFDGMPRKSLISWNSMISACAMHGTAEEALGLFQAMTRGVGVRPDGVTFLAAMSACAHKGLVEEGRRLLESMEKDYKIEAGVEHYGCMVDMLGRAGQLEEAYELIMQMPVPSNDMVWGALLGACRIHGDVNMGERVVEKLLELKPDEGGYYVLLCNIYETAGRREEAMDMRRTMRDRGAKKTPGCSWLGT